MIEDEDAFRGEKIEVGQTEFVGRGGRHGRFKVTNRVVGEVADAAAGKMGKDFRCGEAGHFPFQFRERVVGLARAEDVFPLPDLEVRAARDEFAFRAGAEDGIASALFVLLGGLEKKSGFIGAGDLGERGHWRLGVGHQFGPDRHDTMLRGEGGEFFGARVNVG